MKKSLLFPLLFIFISCGGQTSGSNGNQKNPQKDQNSITEEDPQDHEKTEPSQTDVPVLPEDENEFDKIPVDEWPSYWKYPRMESDINPEIPDYGPWETSCLESESCRESGFKCGYINNGCNEVITCGGCKAGLACENNQCLDSCANVSCETGRYCQVNTYGHLIRCYPGYYENSNGQCLKQEHADITLMAANITSGSYQSYIGPGIRIFKALKPDIVMIQEFNYLAAEDEDYGYTGINEMVYRAFGPEYSYFVGTGKIPNGIVSRYPILKTGNWDDGNGDRDFAWAIIDIPGDTDLLAVSLHIKASESDKGSRITQIGKMKTEIKNLLGEKIKDYFIAVGGDFNLSSRKEQAFTDLKELFVIDAPYPADQFGNDNTNTTRDFPYDGVYVSKNLDDLEYPVILGKSVYKNGLVFDSRVYTPLSEVAPVLAEDCENLEEDDRTQTQMQHMAVMKRFRIW